MELTGSIERIIYHNAASGYSVFVAETEDGAIVCTGDCLSPGVGEVVVMEGDMVFHDRYGEQFAFTSLQKTIPTTEAGIRVYLRSGNIAHIGPAMADRIVDHFRDETREVLDASPERLLEVAGIGPKTLAKILESLEEEQEARHVLMELAEFGIYGRDAQHVYAALGDRSIEVITADPYRLARCVHGFGFRKADAVARKAGIPENDIRRLKAAYLHVLTEASFAGDVYLEEGELFTRVRAWIQPEEQEMALGLTQLVIEGEVLRKPHEGGARVYLAALAALETRAAAMTLRRLQDPIAEEESLIERIDAYLEDPPSDRTYDAAQKNAVRMALTRRFSIITGGPGTGKTTVVRAITEIAGREGMTVKLAAPTGRAAKRMEESAGMDAATLHRLLQLRPNTEGNFDLFGEEVEADLVIVDEASMIDLALYGNLLHALDEETSLVLVGDHDQLPSVGCGNVLRDLLSVEAIPKAYLTQIHRTGEGSRIAICSREIREGFFPTVNERDTDVFFLEQSDAASFRSTLVDLVSRRLPAYYGFDPLRDIQVLCPTKAGPVGTESLNQLLRDALGAEDGTPELTGSGRSFRAGDKVMQIVNNYERTIVYERRAKPDDKGVFNGDVGMVTDVFPDEGKIRVLFGDEYAAEYAREDFGELQLAYAMTVHKAQGSEFPCVIVAAWRDNPLLNNRNLLYTGVSRAKELLVMMGRKELFERMIANTQVRRRHTTLAEKIEEGLRSVSLSALS